ncbi:hypothetical protein PAXRUDRAFT_675423 [Paxillus rubicundulus Ve08.2h10]|uniref:Uncharacterized protein n=1 Tax=Paxillus rubicundulus Ve08.2h10 TaxID=930991 RepID=A0A0D0D229_9AGAM|nr:hypothetical protein PAXRUDRAFT_675423 [Paxillus rubicundulus Ve08.2h10]
MDETRHSHPRSRYQSLSQHRLNLCISVPLALHRVRSLTQFHLSLRHHEQAVDQLTRCSVSARSPLVASLIEGALSRILRTWVAIHSRWTRTSSTSFLTAIDFPCNRTRPGGFQRCFPCVNILFYIRFFIFLTQFLTHLLHIIHPSILTLFTYDPNVQPQNSLEIRPQVGTPAEATLASLVLTFIIHVQAMPLMPYFAFCSLFSLPVASLYAVPKAAKSAVFLVPSSSPSSM